MTLTNTYKISSNFHGNIQPEPIACTSDVKTPSAQKQTRLRSAIEALTARTYESVYKAALELEVSAKTLYI